MPTSHPTPAGTLTPADAAAIAKRARKALRRGQITHHQLTLLDTLLWSCRRPGADRAVVSYTALQRLAHMARETIARGLRALEGLGLLARVKRRIRFAWGHGAVASRQAVSCYVFRAPASTEFGPATIAKELDFLVLYQPDNPDARSAQRQLAAVRERRSTMLFGATAKG